MNSFIDTHAHLYVPHFDDDREQVIERAVQQGISKILLPNIDVDSIVQIKQTAQEYPHLCLPMMGLHPCSVGENYLEHLAIIEKEIKESTIYIAVGEIGLDYYWDKTFVAEQQNAFRKQIGWAKELNIPIAIHTRDSFEDAIQIVEEEQDGTLSGVFHCFGGTAEEGKRAIDIGFYLGIGGVSTFKKTNFAEVLPKLGLERILLETDSPYLAPVPHRGKRNESSYIPLIAQKLATIYEMGLNQIAETTSNNAMRLFNL